MTGRFNSANMSVDVVLAPRNASQMSALLTAIYNPNDRNYHHWLSRGQFEALFAPSPAQIGAVMAYLRANKLVVERSSSPFLVRATGSSDSISAAFRTSLRTYRTRSGVSYFANASPVQLPAVLAAGAVGVVGMTDTVRPHSGVQRRRSQNATEPSCEAGYVTKAKLFNFVNNGVVFRFGYGGGPNCSGLTPSQDTSIYGAPKLGSRAKGAGVNLALFELSDYQHSDIATWAHQFYGPSYNSPLVDIDVDGGPLHPVCPSGDTCPPSINGYANDLSVDSDIEMALAIAPAAQHLLVYNAPSDVTGQTSLDEYARIADDDRADVVNSSWGNCENDVTPSYVLAENVFFEQMALQGQSMFAPMSNTGAFACIDSNGSTIVNVEDPGAQPWLTSVSGTSLESDNPGADPDPAYPTGVETVWNEDNLCSSAAPDPANDNQGGLFWCAFPPAGATGGGNSQYWGRPFYQVGPDVTNPYTAYGNGTTDCSLAAIGTPCREVPDVSVDGDPFTGYAEYCTGNASTPNSACAALSGPVTEGWFEVGGSSLSSVFWSAIIGDRDAFAGGRIGTANQLLYLLYNVDPSGYFHDITGIGQTTNDNGLFPTTPGYDLATGIGTPKMSAIITGFPQP